MGTGLEIAAIAALVASTATATVTSISASQERSRAEEARQRQVQLQERRERARQIREAQRTRANILASSISAGVTPGSASSVTGGISDVTSQLNRNLSFLRQDTRLSLQGSRALARANRLETIGGVAQGIGSAAFSTLGGIQAGRDRRAGLG
jgi:hypothetical protein